MLLMDAVSGGGVVVDVVDQEVPRVEGSRESRSDAEVGEVVLFSVVECVSGSLAFCI